MKKRILSLFFILAIAAAFIACAGDKLDTVKSEGTVFIQEIDITSGL